MGALQGAPVAINERGLAPGRARRIFPTLQGVRIEYSRTLRQPSGDSPAGSCRGCTAPPLGWLQRELWCGRAARPPAQPWPPTPPAAPSHTAVTAPRQPPRGKRGWGQRITSGGAEVGPAALCIHHPPAGLQQLHAAPTCPPIATLQVCAPFLTHHPLPSSPPSSPHNGSPQRIPTWWSPVSLSNSSTQHTPRSASTSAPASKLNSPPSRTTLTVSPAEVLVLPHTYTPRGAAPAAAWRQGRGSGVWTIARGRVTLREQSMGQGKPLLSET